MLALLRLLIPFVLFPAVSAAAFRLAPAFYRLKIFASINILGVLGLCIVSSMDGLYRYQLQAQLEVSAGVFSLYLLAPVAGFSVSDCGDARHQICAGHR